eukprot:3768809-Ditylum_brightwellii.AAC.1
MSREILSLTLNLTHACLAESCMVILLPSEDFFANILNLNDWIPKMFIVQNICKHFKTADAEVRSSFDPQTIAIVPKATTLKAGNSQ